jgi:hypothetical protein
MIKNLALLFISTAALAGCSNDTVTVNSGDGGPGAATDGSTTPPRGEDGSTTPPKGDAGAVHHIDRSHLKNVGTTAALDYGDPALWLCQPGNDPNECHTDIDATEFLKDNTTKVEKHVVLEDPPYDCFYVYPTVLLNGSGNMTDFSDISITLDPLLAQAARFTELCEVYAPLYRQVSLSVASAPADAGADAGSGKVSLGGDATLAYGDVEAAFTYYMAHYNKGRKFVLIGHSQGTLMLTQLVANKFDKDATLRKQLISALLIGGGISVPEGKDVGGSFQNVPLCTKVGQTGCVIAYNSFAKDSPPDPATSLFGRPSAAGMMNACTNPLTLSGNTGRYKGSYSPVNFVTAAFKPNFPMTTVPDVTTPVTMVRDLFNGDCVNENGFSYLQIRPDQTSDDKRPIPPYRNTLTESLGFGLHVADFSIEQQDLLDAVDLQAKAALK